MAFDDRYALAAIAAQDLAEGLKQAAGRVALADKAAKTVKRTIFAIDTVLAPAIRAAADVAEIARQLALSAPLIRSASTPRDAAGVLYEAAAASFVAAPTFASPGRTRQAALARMLSACLEAAWLGEAFVAEAQSDFGDRQSAVAARKRIADAMDASLDRIAAATGQAVTGILGSVARTASDHIATVAADLRPIVRVQTARSAPSTALAFALYGDPSRAPELVSRNRVSCSLFMSTSIDALAPDA